MTEAPDQFQTLVGRLREDLGSGQSPQGESCCSHLGRGRRDPALGLATRRRFRKGADRRSRGHSGRFESPRKASGAGGRPCARARGAIGAPAPRSGPVVAAADLRVPPRRDGGRGQSSGDNHHWRSTKGQAGERLRCTGHPSGRGKPTGIRSGQEHQVCLANRCGHPVHPCVVGACGGRRPQSGRYSGTLLGGGQSLRRR